MMRCAPFRDKAFRILTRLDGTGVKRGLRREPCSNWKRSGVLSVKIRNAQFRNGALLPSLPCLVQGNNLASSLTYSTNLNQ